jgi:hypothetical protein
VKKLDISNSPGLEDLYYNFSRKEYASSYGFSSGKYLFVGISNFSSFSYPVYMYIPKDARIKTSRTTTFRLTYDAAGGLGHMDAEEFYLEPGSSVNFTLPGCGFTAPYGKTFEKWNIGNVGDNITLSSNMTAVAQWKTDSSVPVTEPATVPATVPATTSATEVATKTATEVTTEAATEIATEISTQAEVSTEQSTVKKTEAATKLSTKQEVKTSDESDESVTTTGNSSSGKNNTGRMIILIILLLLLIIIIIIFVIIAKRKSLLQK